MQNLQFGPLVLVYLFTTQSRLLTALKKRPLLKTLWEKEKMLVTSIFSFSHNVFYPFQTNFIFFIHIYFVVCKCFQFRPLLKFAVWSLSISSNVFPNTQYIVECRYFLRTMVLSNVIVYRLCPLLLVYGHLTRRQILVD